MPWVSIGRPQDDFASIVRNAIARLESKSPSTPTPK